MNYLIYSAILSIILIMMRRRGQNSVCFDLSYYYHTDNGVKAETLWPPLDIKKSDNGVKAETPWPPPNIKETDNGVKAEMPWPLLDLIEI